MLDDAFFDRDSPAVARDLLGKVLRRRYEGVWLSAAIVETEAYEITEKGSHASLGRSPSREALFMPPGTIYMYYARGGDSLNISCRGEGNAVLIKAALAYTDRRSGADTIGVMQTLNPINDRPRPEARLCSGQTLLCKSLALRVSDWDSKRFSRRKFYVEDVGYVPDQIVVAKRLGIPTGRDEDLMYRFIDRERVRHATQNPLTRRNAREGVDYRIIG